MRAHWTIGIAALVGACTLPLRGGPDDDLGLRVEAAPARASVTLVLSNDSSEEIGFNLCPSTLERSTGETWEPVLDERVCTLELRLLDSGREARYTLDIPPGLASGRYRYRASVTRMASGTSVSLTSDTFQIAG
jgi:hypothetical protein